MNKRNVVLMVTAVVIMAAGASWAFVYLRDDAEMNELREMRDQMFSEASRQLPEEERHRQREQFRARVEQLSSAQREQLFQEGHRAFEDRIRSILSLPPDERTKAIDRFIDRMESRRPDRTATGDSARRRNGRAEWRRRWDQMSPEERNARRKQRLDRTTPEMRAQMAELRRLVQQRRKERGLPEITGRRGPFF